MWLLGKIIYNGSRLPLPRGGWSLVDKPETTDPALEREKEGEREERTWGRQRQRREKIEIYGCTERRSGSE